VNTDRFMHYTLHDRIANTFRQGVRKRSRHTDFILRIQKICWMYESKWRSL